MVSRAVGTDKRPGDARSIVRLQATTAVAVAAIGLVVGHQGTAQAAFFGAAIALLNSLLMLWRMRRAERQAQLDAHRQLRWLYVSAMERFVAVVAALAIGLKALQLDPLALLAGFIAGQLIWIAYAFARHNRHENG